MGAEILDAFSNRGDGDISDKVVTALRELLEPVLQEAERKSTASDSKVSCIQPSFGEVALAVHSGISGESTRETTGSGSRLTPDQSCRAGIERDIDVVVGGLILHDSATTIA